MKTFILSKKYVEFCDSGTASNPCNFISWFAVFFWPLIFNFLCVLIIGNLFGSGLGEIALMSYGVAMITVFVFFVCLAVFEFEIKYLPHCLLSNWLPIILADIVLLPIVGCTNFFSDLGRRTQKFQSVSIKDFASGNFKQSKVQPFLLGKRRMKWGKNLISEVAREIVHDQIGRALRDENNDHQILREVVAIENCTIDEVNKTAKVHFSVSFCERNSHGEDSIDVGYYFVSLEFDEELNAVDVSNLIFDSKRNKKTSAERVRAFELYKANTSDDFGLGFDPLGLNSRKHFLNESDFSTEPQSVKNEPVAE